MMRRTAFTALLPLPLLVVACATGGTPGTPAKKAAAPKAATAAPPALGRPDLPPLGPAQEHSQALAELLEQAEISLSRAAPQPQGESAEELDAWLRQELSRFIQRENEAFARMLTALGKIPAEPARQRVIGVAVYGLSLLHFGEQLAQLPMPDALAGNPDLENIYRSGLWQAALPSLHKAALSFQACRVSEAAEWNTWCATQHDALTAHVAEAERKAAAAYEAQLLRVQGPRPPGSERCWKPSTGRGPPPMAREPEPPPVPAMVELDAADPGRLPLLEAERAKLQHAVQQALETRYEAQRLRVKWLDAAARKALMTQWAAGRAITGGARCARGVELSTFQRRSLPKLEAANVWANCQAPGSCTLEVDLGRGAVAAALGYQRLQAPLATPLSQLDGWLAGVAALAPADQAEPPPPRTRLPAGTPWRLHALDTHGAWETPEAARDVLEGAEAELLRCAALHADQTRELSAVLAVSAQGGVEALWQPPALAAHGPQDACVAKVLRGLSFGTGAAERRVSLRFSLGGTISESPRDYAYGPLEVDAGVRVSVASEDNEQLSPAPLSEPTTVERLAACLGEGAGASATLELQAELAVAKGGRTRKVQLQAAPESEMQLSPELSRCLQDALKQTRFECTRNDKPAVLRAFVCLRREDVEAPPPASAPAPAAE